MESYLTQNQIAFYVCLRCEADDFVDARDDCKFVTFLVVVFLWMIVNIYVNPINEDEKKNSPQLFELCVCVCVFFSFLFLKIEKGHF